MLLFTSITAEAKQIAMWLFSNILKNSPKTIGLIFSLSMLSVFIVNGIQVTEVKAAVANEWQAGNIMDDSIFYNNGDMSANDIQNFLNSVTPVCDTWGQQPHSSGGTRAQYGASHGAAAPYICVKDYYENPSTHANNLNGTIPPGSTSAAGIIKHAADTYGISARVLIVLLQKEQALITDDWPWPIQYRSATGYGCPDTAPCDAEYYGFYNQTMNAARQFRLYANSPGSYRYKPYQANYIQYNPNAGCGGTDVFIQNKATAGLYNYTPYQPNASALNNLYGSGDECGAYGNRNFWRIFTDWFGKTRGTFLLQSPRSPIVYLEDGNTRYAIPSGNVLWAYGFNNVPVTPVSDSYIDSLTDGGVLSPLFKIIGDPTVYLADNGYRFGIASAALCSSWGFPDCTSVQNVKNLNFSIAGRTNLGPNLTQLALNGTSIYLMNSGKKQPFLTSKALTERGYNAFSATPITNPANFYQPMGNSLPENNSFVQLQSGAIYIYANNSFYLIPNFSTFKGWYTSSSTFQLDLSSAYNSTPPSITATLSRYIFLNTGNKYLLDNGKKIDITQASSSWPDQTNFNVLSSMVAQIPTSATASSTSTYRTDAGLIYRAESKAKKPFYSLTDYFGLGYSGANIINVSDMSTEDLTNGPTLFASGYGSLFKTPTSGQENTIFTSTLNGTSCSLSSLSQLGQFKFNSNNVSRIDTQTNQTFTYFSTLTSFVKSSDGNYHVIDANGSKSSISSQSMANWGISSAPACIFDNAFLNKLVTSNKAVGRFVKNNSGTIFYGDQASKRPITSYQKFLDLGGSESNTVTLPNDFLDLCPTGSPY